ncbi:MAG TPA: DUF4097 family beta strand repeat-containing protein [Blastocatellia bacterium]|jgi:DUF4097 and DUF4098 domain-containing protein YvlB|nr:DUF4097 family beta strand repeat-containing protein [Blastocatellia bacterium]
MSKRIATLLFGIGLIVIGALFFVAPEQAFAVRWLMRLWPVALILAGLVRVAGYLIDRHPRSPAGGLMITAIGGILLSANLLHHNSFILILGKYWFWILLAFIAGRLLKQYTHRFEDGPRPNTFSPGAIVVMILIVGAGLAASFAAKNNGAGFNLRLGGMSVGDYVFGNQISVEDEMPQSFALAPNSRLLINNANGDVEINSAPQSQATARLIRRVRAASVEEARKVAKNISLQITPNGVGYQFNIAATGVQQDFGVSIVVTLPQNLSTGVEINNALGVVKLTDLQGVHVIRGCERAEIARNTGGVTIENPRGAVELSQIQGPVSLTNTHQSVNLRAINGPVTLEVKGGNVRLDNSSGPLQLRTTDAQIDITEVGNDASAAARVVTIEQARNSRIKLQEIKGAVAIKAERSRVEAEEIAGDFKVDSSSDRVRVNRINGVLWIKSENGVVEVEKVRGQATIEATRDVTIRDFQGPLKVSSREGAIDLETPEKLNGDISVVSERGRIRVSIPKDSGFRLDANAGAGRVKGQEGFDDAEWTRVERSYVSGYNISSSSPLVSLRSNHGEIQVRSSGLAMASHDKDD